MLTILWWVFWFLGLFFHGWRFSVIADRYWAGGNLVGWVLLGFLGWKVLGLSL